MLLYTDINQEPLDSQLGCLLSTLQVVKIDLNNFSLQ